MSTEPDRIAAVTQITDHAGAGAALLMRELRSKPRVAAVLAALMARVQDAESALWALLTDTLDTAVGAQLDQLGAVLGAGRGTLSDTDYRAVLRGVVLARRSRGTPADVCAVLRAMLGVGPDFTFSGGGACVLLEPADPLPFSATAAIVPLRLAAAGGVLLELIDPTPDVGIKWFTFAPGEELTADVVKGFGDVAGTTGGYLVGVVT